MSRFWPPADPRQHGYERLRSAVLTSGRLPDELAAARFARRGLAGLIVWPDTEPVFSGHLTGATRPAWTPYSDPRPAVLAATYRLLLETGGPNISQREQPPPRRPDPPRERNDEPATSRPSERSMFMRVGIYARVSSDTQQARETIGSQLQTLRDRITAEGDELIEEFTDDGYSGARLDRPGLDRLRDAAETGAIDAVWCLSPDRLARSYAYQILILDEFARYQVPVRFADAPPLDDPQGRLLVQIQGVIAEHERAKFAERGRRGKLYRSRAGEVLATKIPYGYRRVPRGPDGAAHLIIHEPEAALVRRIFADFLAGDSLRHLAVALSAEGIASPEGKPVWRLSTICRLLRNEAYAGRLYWNRTQTSYDPALGRTRATLRPREEWIEIPIPAIIDEATLEAVAATARDNSSYSPRRTEPDTFLLRRLLRCAHCQVKLNCYRARRNNTTTRYYLCPHRDPWRAGGAEHRCPERRVRADELDTFVFDQVRQLLIRPDLITAGQTAVAAHTPAPDDELLTAQLARLQRRLQNAHTERGRVADLYQAGVIDNPEMTRRCREIDTRSRHLAQEHQNLTARQSELAADNRLSASIANFAQHALWGVSRILDSFSVVDHAAIAAVVR